MTLSSEHSEDKTCPNCQGEGWEPKPPMRKCRLCKGTGKLPDAPTTKGVEPNPSEAHGANERLCNQDQGVGR